MSSGAKEEDGRGFAFGLDVEIEPLTGKPFFPILLQKSHIKLPLAIPTKIARMLPSSYIPVELSYGNKKWETSYHPHNMRFDSRWKKFVADKKLKVGDVCLFEFMEINETRIIKFKVQILRGDFPPQLLARVEGSKERPVVID